MIHRFFTYLRERWTAWFGRPFGQPAGGLRPEPLAASQPAGAHRARGCTKLTPGYERDRRKLIAVAQAMFPNNGRLSA